MREFVSVQSIFDVIWYDTLKKDALMFDKIAINPKWEKHFSFMTPNLGGYFEDPFIVSRTIDWLEEKGIAFRLSPSIWKSSLYKKEIDSEEEESETVYHIITSMNARKQYPHQYLNNLLLPLEISHHTRICALRLNAEGFIAVPFAKFSEELPLQEDAIDLLTKFTKGFSHNKESATLKDVIEITFKFLPTPKENVAWEQILDFREDPDSKAKFIDLREWMNETASGKLTPALAEEKLEYLISQFQRRMELHRLKTNQSSFETVVVSVAEVAEDLVKFKWGKIANSLFEIKKRKALLMEAELNSVGSQVAYIHKTSNVFGRGNK